MQASTAKKNKLVISMALLLLVKKQEWGTQILIIIIQEKPRENTYFLYSSRQDKCYVTLPQPPSE